MMLQRLFLCLLFLPLLSAAQPCVELDQQAQATQNPDSIIYLHTLAGNCWLAEGDSLAWLKQWRKCSGQLMQHQRYREALEALEKVAPRLRTNHPGELGWMYTHMGYQALAIGEVLRAKDHYQRSADLFHQSGTENFVVGSLLPAAGQYLYAAW